MSTLDLNTVKERVDYISDNTNYTINTPYISCKVEICGKCNMKCNFCYENTLVKEGKRQKLLSIEDLELILKALKRVSTLKEIGLFYMGEAGLHPKLAEMYKLCRDNGYFTFLTTNGLLIDNILPAIQYIDSLKVSWNYKNFEDFKTKTGLNDENQYNTIKENTKELIEECHKFGTKLTISTILNPNDKKEDYDSSLKELSYDEHYWIPLQTQAGFKETGLDGVVGEYDNTSSPIPCWSLFRGIYIDSDLNIRTCCYGHDDKFIIGNIKNNDNPTFDKNTFKEKHLEKIVPDICKNCLKNSI